MMPNLIERLENLIASLQEAQVYTEDPIALNAIDDAVGIVGECLTMIMGNDHDGLERE